MSEILFKQESYEIIAACLQVHKELGQGFLEPVYQEALEIEFRGREIIYEREKQLNIQYRDHLLSKFYQVDFLCYGKILVELKAVNQILPEHEAQVINYLRASHLQLGLLVNFGSTKLQWKRLVRLYDK